MFLPSFKKKEVFSLTGAGVNQMIDGEDEAAPEDSESRQEETGLRTNYVLTADRIPAPNR